jgi:putative membrane protein
MLLHGDLPLEWTRLATVAVGITVAGVVYARGWRRYRLRLAGRFAVPQLAAFLGGLACLCAAILPPLDEAADARLSAHMVQHILLLTLAPVLLLLGDPLLPLLRGLPDSWRRSLVAPVLRERRVRRAGHALVHPLVGLLLSSVILWSWHVPVLYQLALRVPAIHLIEHASFFAGGLLFWFPVMQPWPSRPRWPTGAMIPYLLAADVQNTVLAALLTFSDRVVYPFYEFHSRATTAAALDDQVLAGVIMWVPMSLAYLIPAALLTIRLLSPARREAFRRRVPPQGGEKAQRKELRRPRERRLRARFDAVLEERTRLAREIHDTLLQGFTGVALQLVAVTNRLTGSPEAVALRDVVSLAQKTLIDARRAVWDLRSPSLAEGDLTASLRTLAKEHVRGAGLSFEFEVSGAPRPVDPEVQTVMSRVLQEALTNIVKHAAAGGVRVRLVFEPHRLRLYVVDDGRGLGAGPDLPSSGGHWGLRGMWERAAQVRGRLRIRSAPGQGTQIVLLVPYTTRSALRPRPVATQAS